SKAPGAGNWGCESSSATTQYVDAIETDDDGVVRVTVNAALLDLPDPTYVLLEPRDSAGTGLTAGAAGTALTSKVVNQWGCGGSNDEINKLLPGSCSEDLTALAGGTFAAN